MISKAYSSQNGKRSTLYMNFFIVTSPILGRPIRTHFEGVSFNIICGGLSRSLQRIGGCMWRVYSADMLPSVQHMYLAMFLLLWQSTDFHFPAFDAQLRNVERKVSMMAPSRDLHDAADDEHMNGESQDFSSNESRLECGIVVCMSYCTSHRFILETKSKAVCNCIVLGQLRKFIQYVCHAKNGIQHTFQNMHMQNSYAVCLWYKENVIVWVGPHI